jgi:hypothetical protein
MDDAAKARMRALLADAIKELSEQTDRYGFLLSQLNRLAGCLDGGDLDDELVRKALSAFPPHYGSTRAAEPASEGAKHTRRLWDKLNEIAHARRTQDVLEQERHDERK